MSIFATRSRGHDAARTKPQEEICGRKQRRKPDKPAEETAGRLKTPAQKKPRQKTEDSGQRNGQKIQQKQLSI